MASRKYRLLCVGDQRNSSFEQGVLGHPVGPGIELDQGVAYIVRGSITAMPTKVLSKTTHTTTVLP